jgi:hypothetical protein
LLFPDFRKTSGRNKRYAKDQMRSRPHSQAAEFSIRQSLIQGVILLKTRAQVEGMPLVLARFLALFACCAGSAGECSVNPAFARIDRTRFGQQPPLFTSAT